MRNVECGMQNGKKSGFDSKFRNPHSEFALPAQPAAFCGSQPEPPGRGPTRPMLFARKVLTPGPQAKQPGNVNPARGGGLPE
jgi:hypothetical protein